MKNNPKLESFLSKLTDPNLPVEQQSFLLSTEVIDSEGGLNAKNCANQVPESCGTNMGDCVNYGICGDRYNGGSCVNPPAPPVIGGGPISGGDGEKGEGPK